ncbi:hypothetical protein AV274_0019 [Blastocystis sp. ATCC 50177/Nand II]|uniref:Uncharacterized protein n=1 Tax=Blastocystis sp. subtype 1 (strain ATCC 50177 / NandII) TaxID=478820 RepID=A0A196SQ06_BLAHN|nr:hypothetical protein AV274_0019 [Blastocystis sp. ATCC 50177/Nand II]
MTKIGNATRTRIGGLWGQGKKTEPIDAWTTTMSVTFTYSSIDNKWNQFASKGDRIQIVNQGQSFQGTVEAASPSCVLITLDNTGKQVEVKHNSFQIVKRRLTTQNNIPVETGDLIVFTADGNAYTGIISAIDAAANLAAVDVVSNTKVGRQQVAINKLSYLAKGYTTGNMSPMPQVNASSPGSVQIQPQNPQGVPQINTAQNASQIALLYPAPCVVMAVPYNTNPDSFPEAMYVQMPDRAPGQPVLLPVVRMGCDTALVVIPPAKGRGATMVSATPVKATPLQSRPSTTSM